MTQEQVQIRSADLNEARQALEIEWGDGHRSALPLKLLRAECPCASCRTAREESRVNPFRVLGPNERPPSSELSDVEPVGRYALRFIWKDGHQAGLYTYEYLREICPCEACGAARQAGDAPFVHGIFIPP